MKNSELKLKDVIDINRGKKLGFIDDIDFEAENGRIKAFVVPTYKNKLFNFFSRKQDIIIGWEDIIKIGEDVILVEIKEDISLKN
ncbi:MAG: YlmC/YmxH family sporulation protein [Halanaerobiales bacterium]